MTLAKWDFGTSPRRTHWDVKIANVQQWVQKWVLSATSIVENANVRQMLKVTSATNANQTIGTCLTMSTDVSLVTAQTLAENQMNAILLLVLAIVMIIMTLGLNAINVLTVTIAIQNVIPIMNLANWSTKGIAQVVKHGKVV